MADSLLETRDHLQARMADSLLETRDHLQARTQQRIVADWSVQQVLILLKSTAATGDVLWQSRDILRSLMDESVRVIVMGIKLCFLIFP